MAVRYEIEHVVQESLPLTVTYLGAPVARRAYTVVTVTANASILDLSGNALTLYTGETGAGTTANPTTANATTGAIEAWVAAPDYDIAVSGTSITSYTQKVRQSPQGTYNVKSYGAKSDGSTNDNTKIQAAYTAAATAGSGNIVHFPNTGTYINSGALTTPNSNAIFLTGVPPVTIGHPTVTSAATLNLPPNAGSLTVTGATVVTNMGAWPAGSLITLHFTSGQPQFTDGGNINLAGNYVPISGGTLTLRSDGANWHEVARKTT